METCSPLCMKAPPANRSWQGSRCQGATFGFLCCAQNSRVSASAFLTRAPASRISTSANWCLRSISGYSWPSLWAGDQAKVTGTLLRRTDAGPNGTASTTWCRRGSARRGAPINRTPRSFSFRQTTSHCISKPSSSTINSNVSGTFIEPSERSRAPVAEMSRTTQGTVQWRSL